MLKLIFYYSYSHQRILNLTGSAVQIEIEEIRKNDIKSLHYSIKIENRCNSLKASTLSREKGKFNDS